MEDVSGFVSNSMDGYNKQPSGLVDDNAPSEGNMPKEPYYTMPGVLHFLQTEWAKFEMDRSQWEVERAELQARIAFLQGERKGQENLKHDLVRRIKMLEFALKQERAKLHRLQFGTSLPPDSGAKPDAVVGGEEGVGGVGMPDPEELLRQTSAQTAASKAKAKDGRQLIRQYLQEIGYTDVILDVKQARVQQIIGSGCLDETDAKQQHQQQQQLASPPEQQAQHQQHQQQQQHAAYQQQGQQKQRGRTIEEQMSNLLPGINITGDDDEGGSEEDEAPVGRFAGVKEELSDLSEEAQVIAEFDFLVTQQESGEQGDQSAGMESTEWVMDEKTRSKVEAFKAERIRGPKKSGGGGGARNLLNAFADETDSGGSPPPETEPTGPYPNLDDPELSLAVASPSASASKPAEDEGFRSALGLSLGDLQDITVANESEGPGPDARRAWTAKFSLRSHFDSVRALAFHPTEAALVTASDDGTLKLWNVGGKPGAGHQQAGGGKKAPTVDLEPNYTFRGHTGPVLALRVGSEQLYSAGIDGSVRVWSLPPLSLDVYDAYDPTLVGPVLEGHTDAVWGLAVSPGGSAEATLFSAGADLRLRAWRPRRQADQLLATWQLPAPPTSVNVVATDAAKLLVSLTNGQCLLVDAETGQTVASLADEQAEGAANAAVSHPTQGVTVAAYDDRHLRFFDNASGAVVHSMVAHLDSVTSLAVDSNGLYLLSGSHDCSVRLWNLDDRTCVQEITAHRKKFDEAINDVALHPTKSFLASAGADALAKVFV